MTIWCSQSERANSYASDRGKINGSNVEQNKNAFFILILGSSYVHHTRQFNTSLQHKRATPFVPPKSVSSTQKTVSSTYKKRLFNTKNVSSTLTLSLCSTDAFLCCTATYVLNRCFFDVELTHVTCWTDNFRGLKSSGPCVELMCWSKWLWLDQNLALRTAFVHS